MAENNQTKVILKGVNVVKVEGISKKSGRKYTMLRIETGNQALDNSLKANFLDDLQLLALNNMLE